VRLIFLENRDQVSAVHDGSVIDRETTLVPVTAQALDALEELGLPNRPVSSFARPSVLSSAERDFTLASVQMLAEIESYVAERHPPARFDEPGFLVAQDYNVQVSIGAIATRTFLMVEAIRALRPVAVAAFVEITETWFAADGYAEPPWLLILERLSRAEGFRLERLRLPVQRAARDSHSSLRARLFRAVSIGPCGIARHYAVRVPSLRWGGGGLRLLFVGRPHFDWLPVVGRLGSQAECFWVAGERLDADRDWTMVLGNRLRRLGRRKSDVLGPPFNGDEGEAETVAELVRAWFRQERPTLDVLGIDILPGLEQNLVAIASRSPAIVRHVDAVAERALDLAAPHAVCFPGMTLLPAKRIAHLCRARGIDVVSYQHGGAYSTHEWTPHDLADWGHADYFLTYGEGIRPPAQPAFPVRARFVPVGSARIASWRERETRRVRSRDRALRVLWIAEMATRNIVNYALVEDTERYLLEWRCLELLHAAGVDVTYRPYAGQTETSGVLRRLRRERLGNVRISEHATLEQLIRDADVVVSDSASGTAWNEVIALGKPFVLYCEPGTARLASDFAADLARACRWTTTPEEFTSTLEELARGANFACDEQDVERFLERYVLHDGRPADAVASFLQRVCRDREPLEAM